MKKVSLRDFQRNASDYIDKLPIELTRYGKPIAQVHQLSGVPDKDTLNRIGSDLAEEEKDKDNLRKSIKRASKKVAKDKDIKLCPHGYLPALCKHGKCRKKK